MKNINLITSKTKGKWAKGWWNNLDRRPHYFRNYEELKSFCQKKNVIPRAVAKYDSQEKKVKAKW